MLRALYRFALTLAFAAILAVAAPTSVHSPLTPAQADPAPAAAAAAKLAIYDELADANRDVRAALVQAGQQRKLVALVFGANWCPDCRAFNEDTDAADLGSALALNYVVVKIDVGRFKKNLDVAQRYGLNAKRGIPAVVLVGADDKTIVVADGRKIEELRGEGRKALIKFFDTTVSAQKSAASKP